MARFRVKAKMTTYCYLDVEAESPAEALNIGEETDGGEYITEEDGDWEVYEVEPLANPEEAADEQD